MKRVAVLGGYGGFGRRIAQLLAERGFHVVVAGRTLEKAKAFCAQHDALPLEPGRLDRNRIGAEDIAALDCWALVDAAGPWQGDDYRLPEACITAGCHYCDIADARSFVAEIAALDEAAKAAGVAVISGASTAPALVAAACDAMAADLDRVTKIDIALSASNNAASSASITGAVLSYAGQPLPLWRGGTWRRGFGWHAMERVTFDTGGSPYRRLVGQGDVPDNVVLPGRYRGRPAVSFKAGTEIGIQNRAIWLAGWPVRWKAVRNARWLGGPARFVQSAMAGIGGERSAMRIALTGWRGNDAVRKQWELLAEQGDGPWVPSLAVPVLLEKLRDGEIESGARHAAGAVTLADYDRMLSSLAISHRTEERAYVPLYRRVMGKDFERLPPPVRVLHEVAGELSASGRASVVRSRNILARIVAWLFRFPRAVDDAPVSVWMDERDGIEVWRRRFGDDDMHSEMSQHGEFLVERFGLLRFGFRLEIEERGLAMQLRRWWCGPVRLPMFLAPQSTAREFAGDDGRFHFDVPIGLPLIGPVVHYRGWLEPDDPERDIGAP